MKVEKNVIEIPITEKTTSKYNSFGLTSLFRHKVTIYNDISADGVNPRRFDKHIIDGCMIYNQITEGGDGTIQKVVNAQSVITKDVQRYKSPLEYARLPVDEKEKYYTVQVDDFVVLDAVDDVVTTSREFQELQKKYAKNGFSVTAVNVNINGMSVDNIQITHA